ncbi:MAG: acetyl-CoA carboxylase biotin carboxylase subunit [Nitrospirae bacterium]|nr:acetyl-CoA carboxylase biotin carboxylase subunit [Nitrospirota bacterium]
MFKKVLIANRGEIALRIIRSCKELNIATVAIHSEADATTLYVKKADESCLVGPGPVAGYLNIYRIIDLARQRGVDAIHPGYGFLAENHEFAEACEENGITFIGPSPNAIRTMGDKILARQMMMKAGISVVPGIDHGIGSFKEAEQIASEIGYPVMLKASAGGGGRGLRLCHTPDDLKRCYDQARSEALKAFGKDDVYIEKYIVSPRHIEFQILADNYGNIVHLGERDCSIQRRHQKLIEVAPSPFLDTDLRDEMGQAAVKAAQAAGYSNAGTIEFLVDKDRNYYFLEMNTRIQVEHTITEEITGIDVVKEMIKIAAGEKLEFTQSDIQISGAAIECRINAEDPKNNFLPVTGRLTAYYSPGGFGVRIDGNVYRGYLVPPYYDSMLAKLTVWGRNWDEAVDRTIRSLDEFVIRGVKTTIPFYRMIMRDDKFRKGDFDTHYIDNNIDSLVYEDENDRLDLVYAIATAIAAHTHR